MKQPSESTVKILLNLTEPAVGLACSTLSTDLPTFFVDRFPSVKNDLSHKQTRRIGQFGQLDPRLRTARIDAKAKLHRMRGGGRLNEASALENDLHLLLIQQCNQRDYRPFADGLGPSLEVDGPRRGKSSELSLAEWCQEYQSEWSAAENHPGTAPACPLEPLQL